MGETVEGEYRLVRVRDGAAAPVRLWADDAPLRDVPAADDVREPTVGDYWRVLVKRRWAVFAAATAGLVVAAVGSWTATPVYRATTRLQVDPEQQNVLPFQGAGDPGAGYAQSQEHLETQFKVLGSRALAERVVEGLGLGGEPAFAGDLDDAGGGATGVLGVVRVALGLAAAGDPGEGGEAATRRRRMELAGRFLEALDVEPLRGSRLVDVSFESPDAVLAARVANELAAQYIQMNFETRYEAATAATGFLSERLVDLKARVERSEEELAEFGRRHDIYEGADRGDVAVRKMSDLDAALTEAQAERIRRESVWEVAREAATAGAFPEALRNALIRNLEEAVSTLRREEARLSAQFRPGWPQLDQVSGQLAEAEGQLVRERGRAVENAGTEYRTALQRERLLERAMEVQKARVDELNQDSIQYKILQRQAEADKQLYEGLLQRMKEAGVSAGLQSSNIHVVDAAEVPPLPWRPAKARNLAVGLGAGLALGVVLALFIERLDDSIKTPEDVERIVELPSLGVIPAYAPAGAVRGRLGGARAVGGVDVESVAQLDSRSPTAEAYRNARTSVMLSSGAGAPPRVLLVTSSHAGEGKTTSAVNLAVTLAQTGERVALLDCDMRKPRVHRVMDAANDGGMSTYLSGNAPLAEVEQATRVPNLVVVAAGPVPPNPSELLGSVRMAEALEALRGRFRYVVIDSPPVLEVTDARVLASVADGVVLVVKGGETARGAVLHAKRMIQGVGGRLLGTLLNNVDVRSADYRYYSGGYSYGEGVRGDGGE
jgi:capsular exopolysaccharide synthesis family protein